MILQAEKPIALCSDHAGYATKQAVIAYLEQAGIAYKDFGTYSEESCDYPDFAHKCAEAVESGECYPGIGICGTGEGVCMTLNKHQHVRAALCWQTEIAHLARLHNDANVLVMPGRFLTLAEADAIMDEFLATPFEGGRHMRRIEKIPCQG